MKDLHPHIELLTYVSVLCRKTSVVFDFYGLSLRLPMNLIYYNMDFCEQFNQSLGYSKISSMHLNIDHRFQY